MEETRNFGVILGNRKTDWLLGAIPHENRNPSGDWTPYLPQGEWQKDLQTLVDTMGCVSFSALNSVEIQMKFLTGSAVDLSDRFTATLSGTTKQGNYLWRVADTIRKYGVVPEVMWPDPPQFTWDTYYTAVDISVIDEGVKWLEEWQVNYVAIPNPTREVLMHELKHAPIQVVIPGHAIINFFTDLSVQKYFDTYDPFIKEYVPQFEYAQKIVLTRSNEQMKYNLIRDPNAQNEVYAQRGNVVRHIANRQTIDLGRVGNDKLWEWDGIQPIPVAGLNDWNSYVKDAEIHLDPAD